MLLSAPAIDSRPRRRAPLIALIALIAPGALVALVLAGSGCSAPEEPRPDIIVVVVDTLRADKLGAYGSQLGLTPALDRLATESVVFEQAASHAPWTLPSFASLFTSQPPPLHGAGGGLTSALEADFRVLPESAETLAETLRAAGYSTGLIGNVAFLGPAFGLQQGFEQADVAQFESNQEVRDARATTAAALAWFEQAAAPRFLVVHYFDPHAVYAPPPEFRASYAAPEDQAGGFVFGTRADLSRLRRGELELNESVVRRAERLYNGEVAFVDQQIGALLAGLDGHPDDRFLVFTADHGEEFWDHEGFEHGHTLYQELIHVPLFVQGPGLGPRRIATPVGQVDLAPTLCDLVAVRPAPEFRGRSLARALRAGTELASGGILAEGNMWGPVRTSWRHGSWKLIRPGPGTTQVAELYDLKQDPGETRNVAESDHQRYNALEDELTAVLGLLEGTPGQAAQLPDDVAEALAELGYLPAAPADGESK